MYNISQSNVSINENTTVKLFNDERTTVQGPTDDNNKTELQKACTIEMSMNNGDILTVTMIELEQERRTTRSSYIPGPYIQVIQYNTTCNKFWSVKRWLMNTEAWWKKEGI